MPSPASTLRVCIVVPYDLSERGGVKHHAFEVAHALRHRGDHVDIVGPATEDPKLEGVMSFGGIVNVRSNASDNRMALFVSPWKLRRYFREGAYDVIHVHEPPIPSVPYWTAWLTPGVAKICTFHAFNETPSAGIHFGQKVCQVLQERFYDHSLAVSEAAKRHASYAWTQPFTIVPNGVSLDVFTPRAPGDAHRGPLRLLFVGRLSDDRKGLRFMLEAYEQLRARGVLVALDIVGEQAGAPVPPALPGLTYHGPVPRSELVRRFQQCDVYVAPSTGQESFGIVLLEAMATGAPIVCSDIEGYRAVANAEGAVLVPPRDSAAIAAAVEALAKEPERRALMSAVNLEHVQTYDWSRVAARVRDEYLVAIQNRVDRTGGTRRALPSGGTSTSPRALALSGTLASLFPPPPAAPRHAPGRAYRILRWIPVVLVVVACAYAAHRVDTHALGRSLLTVRFWPLGLALVFSVFGVVARAAYWWVLVRPVARVPLRTMISYGFASCATNVLPLRAGDALRVWLVSSRHGVPVAVSGAIIAMEKVSDVASLLLLISPLPWLIPDLPPSVGQALRVCSGIVLASVVAIVVASRHASRWKVLAGFSVVRQPKVVLAGAGFVFLAWVCDVSSILSVLMAVHLAPTLDKALLVILSVNVAIAVPVTPGQVGVHELGSTVALALVGVAQAQALPFAVLYHAIQLFPVLVGLSSARTLARERLATEGLVAASP